MDIELENDIIENKTILDNNELINATIENNALENGMNLEQAQELTKEENSFFESTFGKIVNSGIEIGIKAVLPNFLEDEVIEIKNAIINDGFKEGLKECLNSCKDIGKSFKGIVTGNFESIDQLNMAVKKGGLIDTISKGIDTSLKIAVDSELLDKNISKIIKSGKNILLDSVSSNIEEGVKEQVKNIEKLKEHSAKWQTAFENKDFSQMKKSYTFVKKYSEKVMPVEEVINKSNEIENIQNLLENNGGNFDIEDVKLELAKVL